MSVAVAIGVASRVSGLGLMERFLVSTRQPRVLTTSVMYQPVSRCQAGPRARAGRTACAVRELARTANVAPGDMPERRGDCHSAQRGNDSVTIHRAQATGLANRPVESFSAAVP